jgi:hypothetical protein
MKAVINNNKIKSVFDGNPECIPISPTDTVIEVPYGFTCKEGDDIRMWDANYNLRNAEDLISDGYIVLKLTEKIVDHKVVEKTLQEQYDEGIYIPEEGWIVFDNKLWKLADLEKYRNERLAFISLAFDNAMATSHFMSTALGIEIDCRRSATKNDLQNIQTLSAKMDREGWTEVEYVGYTATKVATKQNLKDMTSEMEDYALGLYQYKWAKWELVSKAKTIQELEEITW